MGFECLDNIIHDDIAINIDVTDNLSWDLNTNYLCYSLDNWSNSMVGKLTLNDYGLCGSDFGKTERCEGVLNISTNQKFFMNRVGYLDYLNPTTIETSGYISNISYDGYDITHNLSGETGRYFVLDGGYLNGFYKLDGYNLEYLPARYNNGITIETMLILSENTNGIFYYMGCRSEDKYSPHFSGEVNVVNNNVLDGVYTSELNFLDAIRETEKIGKSFILDEDKYVIEKNEANNTNNIKNNVIAFGIDNKKLFLKYIDENLNIIKLNSNNEITSLGSTLITITYKPNSVFTDEHIDCKERRFGEMKVFVNGRINWLIKNFPEFYFRALDNEKEKQIGVPYNISWGGGSFGLKHSVHYNEQNYVLFNETSSPLIVDSFKFREYEFPVDCETKTTNLDEFVGRINSGNFVITDTCGIEHPIDVIELEYQESLTNNSDYFYYEYSNDVNVLPNREYTVKLKYIEDEFFITEENGVQIMNTINITLNSTETDIEIIEENKYVDGDWNVIELKYKIPNNVYGKNIKIGILGETNHKFNNGGNIYVKEFSYYGRDILVNYVNENNKIIEDNFGDEFNFNGGIQKLRVYLKPLSVNEVKHNAKIEFKGIPNKLTNGGRIIYSNNE